MAKIKLNIKNTQLAKALHVVEKLKVPSTKELAAAKKKKAPLPKEEEAASEKVFKRKSRIVQPPPEPSLALPSTVPPAPPPVEAGAKAEAAPSAALTPAAETKPLEAEKKAPPKAAELTVEETLVPRKGGLLPKKSSAWASAKSCERSTQGTGKVSGTSKTKRGAKGAPLSQLKGALKKPSSAPKKSLSACRSH